MKHILLLLCLVSCANLEKKTFQHFYISRKIRSNSEPKNTGYMYSQVNNQPASFSTFYNRITNNHSKGSDNLEQTNLHKRKLVDCKECSKIIDNHTTAPLQSRVRLLEKLTEAKKNDNPASTASHMITRYDMGPGFHTDDEDVRTDPGHFYDGWPYFYHTPYEYEPNEYDIEVEKAKDKRFVEPRMERIIPVHENHDDISNNYIYSGPNYRHTQTDTTDNPIFGNKPFFSYILNDYFDKSYDDDPLVFKGISWENEFNNEIPPQDIDDYARRIRHLDNNYPNQREGNYLETTTEASHGLDSHREIIKSNKYDNKQDTETTKKGNDKIHRHKSGQNRDKQKYKEFKDFTDAFANKFGSEDHNKISKYSVKNNADKGEKKKGFRKVYHKDEYQEHNEFFDDNNNSINTEEHGDSKVRIGSSEALLGSKAAVVSGHEGKTSNIAEDVDTNLFEKKYEDSKRLKGIDNNLKSYRDVGKNIALSNSDYFDGYVK
ncbi:unnamed protein product, partial [Brenthis ino]